MTLCEIFPNSKNNHYGKTFEVLELGNPKRTASKFKLLCTVCNCAVEMMPIKVFAGQKACKCSTMYYRNSGRRIERLLEKLADKNITAITIPENLKWHHYIDLECNCCNYKWSAQENNLVNYNAGCPDCAGVRKLTKEEVEVKLSSVVSKSKIENYVILDSHWSNGLVEVQCNCGHKRTVTPRSAYYDSDSCTGCAVSGFKSLQPATLYLLELKNTNGIILGYKYGIAGNMQQRHKKISRAFQGKISLWYSWDYPIGRLAQEHENTFKKSLPSLLSSEILSDGWTETFDKEFLSTFLKMQDVQYKEVYYRYFT